MRNAYFLVAAMLTLILALAHSVLGELLLLRKLAKDQLPPLLGSNDFTLRTLRTVWHVTTAFGLGFGVILLYFSLTASPGDGLEFVKKTTTFSILLSSLILGFGTKGKHPGWLVLFVIAVFAWLGTAVE